MAKVSSNDESQVIALLKGALGDVDTKQTLGKIATDTPAFGSFEWMLTILAIEIDLRVDIPEPLSDNRKLTLQQFAAKVAALPKVASKTFTLDSLVLLAQALLTLDVEGAEEPKKTTRKATAKKAAKKKAAKKIAEEAVAKTTRGTTRRGKAPEKAAKKTAEKVTKKVAKKTTKKARKSR